MEVSKCAEVWDSLEESKQKEVFKKHLVTEAEYKKSYDSLVMAGVLIYRINGAFYKEKEAWCLLIGVKSFRLKVIEHGHASVDYQGRGKAIDGITPRAPEKYSCLNEVHRLPQADFRHVGGVGSEARRQRVRTELQGQPGRGGRDQHPDIPVQLE